MTDYTPFYLAYTIGSTLALSAAGYVMYIEIKNDNIHPISSLKKHLSWNRNL